MKNYNVRSGSNFEQIRADSFQDAAIQFVQNKGNLGMVVFVYDENDKGRFFSTKNLTDFKLALYEPAIEG